MISLSLAKRLKKAGLVWQAGVNDFFAIPDRDLDNRIFVVADLLANLNILSGWPAVTFHGTAEWALDYILTTEVVWLPREEQLRQTIISSFPSNSTQSILLSCDGSNYQCRITVDGRSFEASSATAADAYGAVLLHLLQENSNNQDFD